jgi:hypothetical protein
VTDRSNDKAAHSEDKPGRVRPEAKLKNRIVDGDSKCERGNHEVEDVAWMSAIKGTRQNYAKVSGAMT